MTFTAFDEFGAERTKSFVQGMLNRLGFGAARYGRTHEDDKRDSHPTDMVNTAVMRALIGLQHGKRESLIDAANFLVLAYHHMPETPAWDGDSPGVVYGGYVASARGRFAVNNGRRFDASELRPTNDDPVRPSQWVEEHFTGGPARWDVV